MDDERDDLDDVDNGDVAEGAVKPRVRLTGGDGNAYVILAACRCAAKRAKWPPEKIKAFTDAATSGNYDHLLATCMEWFDVD